MSGNLVAKVMRKNLQSSLPNENDYLFLKKECNYREMYSSGDGLMKNAFQKKSGYFLLEA